MARFEFGTLRVRGKIPRSARNHSWSCSARLVERIVHEKMESSKHQMTNIDS